MRRRCMFGAVFTVISLISAGCGGRDGNGSAATSQEELAEFLAENPGYADTPAPPGSSKTPLELGR